MADIRQSKALSTPRVVVDGTVIPVVPNSVKATIPGEIAVRAMSAGGGAIQIVSGVDAETLKSKVSFSLANTVANVALVRGWKAAVVDSGFGVAIRLEEKAGSYAYTNMILTNENEIGFESEGSIDCEFEGDYQG